MNPLRFYRLNPLLDDDTIMVDIASHEDYFFTAGCRFEEPVPEPVEFAVDEGLGGTRWPTLLLPQPVFRADFVAELRRLGVANIDDYAARVVRASTAEVRLDYRAVNIVGAIACADLERSTFDRMDTLYQFERLVIDPGRTGGADFFRLAEDPEIIVVAASVAERIDRTAFPDLLLELLE